MASFFDIRLILRFKLTQPLLYFDEYEITENIIFMKDGFKKKFFLYDIIYYICYKSVMLWECYNDKFFYMLYM